MSDMVIGLGDVLTIDALEWHEGWEFDNPKVILRPVYREFDTGSLDSAIESMLLDAVANGRIGRSDDHRYGLSLATMKIRFAEALRGRKFPSRNYRAKRVRVLIVEGEEGLLWEDIEEGASR